MHPMYRHRDPDTPSRHPRRRLNVAQAAAMAFLAIFLVSIPPSTHAQQRSGLTIGVRQAQFDTQMSTGLVHQFTDHVLGFGALDLGAGRTAAQLQGAITFDLDHCCKLGFLVGPEILSVQQDPDVKTRVQYLNGATGIFFLADLGSRFSGLAIAEKIATESSAPTWFMSARIAVWFGEG